MEDKYLKRKLMLFIDFRKINVDSSLALPHVRAVLTRTLTRLTSVFEKGTGDPRRYDRPIIGKKDVFIKVIV